MNENEQVVRQTTMILPYFDYEVPVLYLRNGTPYIPVMALCEMLGLHTSTHIQHWRKLVLWVNARKLPLRTARGKRIVWCLHLGALPFWCACFRWSLVNPERRAQLHQATDEWLRVIEQAQKKMLAHYEYMRRLLFEFLIAYVDADTKLSQFVLHLTPHLEVNSCMQLERLVSRGQTLINEATTHARILLHEQITIPIVDAVTLDPKGEVTETISLPLFPVVPRKDYEGFFEHISKLTQWYREMASFLGKESL